MTKILVMAQGRGSRWGGKVAGFTYKQLVSLGEETIISRTFRQLKERDVPDPILVAKACDFEGVCARIIELKEPTFSILHGILSLRDEWMNEEEFVFVLGDVIFSNDALDRIFSDIKDVGITFYGRLGANKIVGKEAKEIFALRVLGGRTTVEEFYREILKLREEANSPQKLKLWSLYHHLNLRRTPFNFIDIDDYSDDLDSPKHYVRFFSKLVECVNADDEARLQEKVLLPET